MRPACACRRRSFRTALPLRARSRAAPSPWRSRTGASGEARATALLCLRGDRRGRRARHRAKGGLRRVRARERRRAGRGDAATDGARARGGRAPAGRARPAARRAARGCLELRLTTEDHLGKRTETLREGFAVESAAAIRSWEDGPAGQTRRWPPSPKSCAGSSRWPAATYVEYERAFSHVFAEESYQQDAKAHS